MIEFTIFTPTYNRGTLLRKLYWSLEQQTCKAFEWLIVDDGSVDDTEYIIDDLRKKASFSVRYIKKENKGKHIAINVGAANAKGKWFFIVDSDDYLLPNAVERSLFYIRNIEDNVEFAGVVGLRGNRNGTPLEKWYTEKNNSKNHFVQSSKEYSEEYIDATYIEYRYKFKRQGDRAEIVRTELIRMNPFPQFDNEKFLVESHIWLTLAKQKYRFRWFNEVIYITEYRDDGLTKNIKTAYKNSPKGSCYINNLKLSCRDIPLKVRIKASYNYFAYGFIAKKGIIILIKENLCKPLIPVGLLLAIIKKK